MANTTRNTVLLGDVVERLRELPDNSIDAIVTDPPYGLEFMGKEWDGFGSNEAFEEWCRRWGVEALRVLKPGGHLLAFGGTRTYHRLVSGLEDAGFEIRDTIAWLYGSGFPKSLDVSKAIDKAAGAEREVVGPGLNAKAKQRHFEKLGHDGDWGVTDILQQPGPTITAPATDAARTWSGFGTALKPAWESIVVAQKAGDLPTELTSSANHTQQCVWNASARPAEPHSAPTHPSSPEDKESTAPVRALTMLAVEQDQLTPTGEAVASSGQTATSSSASAQVSTVSNTTSWSSENLDGSSSEASTSTTSTGTSKTTVLTISASSTGTSTLLSTLDSQVPTLSAIQPDGEPLCACLAGESSSAGSSSWTPTPTRPAPESATELSQAPFPDKGVRPDLSPIVVARKPLTGTVASNVIAWGTGALNVDGCRIGTGKDKGVWPETDRQLRNVSLRLGHAEPRPTNNSLGRWPANVAFDEEAAAMLDEQSGVRPGGAYPSQRGKAVATGFGEGRPTEGGARQMGDTGGASRFFYCAKASRADREAGLVGLPERRPVHGPSGEPGGLHISNSKTPRANDHPTVKPNSLMRWLCRLVGGQPGSLILDPFAGSGSTLRAAQAEGFEFLGIERDRHYYRLACLRAGLPDPGEEDEELLAA